MAYLVLFALLVFCAFVFYYVYQIYLASTDDNERLAKLPGYKRGVQGLDEYSRLLSMFNLDDMASEEEIKAAYRQVMREHHPDTSKEKSEEEIAKFMELKAAYERILEIKRGRF